MRVFPLVTQGSYCPHCGSHTYRVRMPLLLRPVRQVFPDMKRRACMAKSCSWHGFALPQHAHRGVEAFTSVGG